MNTQMSLDEYIKRALDYCQKQYPTFTEDFANSQKMSRKDWEDYYKDFSPEVAIQGMVSGLI